ncbi:hypothetical protein ACJX0J_042560, partial [Zea mays]
VHGRVSLRFHSQPTTTINSEDKTMLRRDLPLVTFVGTGNQSRIAVLAAFDPWQDPVERRTILQFDDYNKTTRHFYVHASCDGLVVLKLLDQCFYVCNPATLQWLKLRALYGSNFAALYPHPSSNNEKEYHILYYSFDPIWYYKYYVLKLGSHEPRCIGQPTHSESTKNMLKTRLPDTGSAPPVLVRHRLHWIHEEQQLIVFDTITESFSSMSPATTDTNAHLLRIDDTLHMGCVRRDGTMTLWALKNGYWDSTLRIQLPLETIPSFDRQHFVGKVISDKGDVLISCHGSQQLFYCDSTSKAVTVLQSDEYPIVSGHWFQESLVAHDFFRMQGGDLLHPHMPRFLQGFSSSKSAWCNQLLEDDLPSSP